MELIATLRDKKGAQYVRYLYGGLVSIVLAATLCYEQGHATQKTEDNYRRFKLSRE